MISSFLGPLMSGSFLNTHTSVLWPLVPLLFTAPLLSLHTEQNTDFKDGFTPDSCCSQLLPMAPALCSYHCPDEFFLLLHPTNTAYILVTSSSLICTSILSCPNSDEQPGFRNEILVTLTASGTS